MKLAQELQLKHTHTHTERKGRKQGVVKSGPTCPPNTHLMYSPLCSSLLWLWYCSQVKAAKRYTLLPMPLNHLFQSGSSWLPTPRNSGELERGGVTRDLCQVPHKIIPRILSENPWQASFKRLETCSMAAVEYWIQVKYLSRKQVLEIGYKWYKWARFWLFLGYPVFLFSSFSFWPFFSSLFSSSFLHFIPQPPSQHRPTLVCLGTNPIIHSNPLLYSNKCHLLKQTDTWSKKYFQSFAERC